MKPTIVDTNRSFGFDSVEIVDFVWGTVNVSE